MENQQSFTGRGRRRQTSWTVRFIDRAAGGLIAVGGISVILAVFLVCVFLVSVVLPLFSTATVGERNVIDPNWSAAAPVRVGVDEYLELGWNLLPDGTLQTFRLSGGETISQENPFAPASDADAVEQGNASPPSVTAWTVNTAGTEAAFGFSDGTVRTASLGFNTTYVDFDDAPESLKSLEVGEITPYEAGVAKRVSQSQFRTQRFVLEVQDPLPASSDASITLIDYASRSSGPIMAILTADGSIHINSFRERENLLTGEVTVSALTATLPLPEVQEKPSYLLLSGLGDMVYAAWKDGRILRFDIRDLSAPRLVEDTDLVPEPDQQLTVLKFLTGRSTLIAGDSLGRVRAWFPARSEEHESKDDWNLAPAHTLPTHSAAVTSLAVSPRSRLIAVGYADGRLNLMHVTSESSLASMSVPDDNPVQSLTISPKSDAVIAVWPAGLAAWEFEEGHPESSFATLFRPVWYEGYATPEHIWQTSSGQDSAEPKYGLWPLVFGTLKATFYSMMFGAPIALFAAIFTSEFLQPRLKARIKPTIEMMASLPSVVLGFLAGLVLAPLVESIVAPVVTIVYVAPLFVLSCAYLWQMLPPTTSIRLARYRFLMILLLALPGGLALGWFTGPFFERLLFAGDLRAWLDGQVGSPIGGWMLLFIPLSAIASSFIMSRTVNPWMRSISADWSRPKSALADFLKFIGSVALTIGIALLVSFLLTSLRFDPRGTYLDTYVQRNAMIVGFIMGFAIIPIIYTIADDALSSVPEHLRSASLGAGATPWQTAVRIVIPTAMSGLFSAVMIGLGRAVGETMIVLMAAGNTPILEWNIFNGFQTLSAAIATELSEAPPGETHYRVLFLAALTLFVMTFILNTIAESIRLRFRRRAYEL